MSVWEQQPLKRVACACVIDRRKDSDPNHSVCPSMGEHLSSSSSSQVGQVLKALLKAGPHRETADSRIKDVLGCSPSQSRGSVRVPIRKEQHLLPECRWGAVVHTPKQEVQQGLGSGHVVRSDESQD